MKTLTDYINEVLDLSEKARKNGNKEAYNQCIELLADMLYTAKAETLYQE